MDHIQDMLDRANNLMNEMNDRRAKSSKTVTQFFKDPAEAKIRHTIKNLRARADIMYTDQIHQP